jgi:hypothetical protein
VRRALAVALALVATGALAIEDRANIETDAEPGAPRAWSYKLTPTWLRDSEARGAFDLNLRGNRDAHVWWVGHYQRGTEFQQTRAGYEYQLALGAVRIIASAQVATRGFLGGSLTFESLGRAYGLAGIGRTNERAYFNLNFDPNDSFLVGAGWRQSSATTITLFQVRDDRLATGQRVTHFVLRTRPSDRERWTIDAFRRSGWSGPEADEREVRRGTGVGITYDRDPYFARVVWDRRVNFTGSDMVRVAVGIRF